MHDHIATQHNIIIKVCINYNARYYNVCKRSHLRNYCDMPALVSYISIDAIYDCISLLFWHFRDMWYYGTIISCGICVPDCSFASIIPSESSSILYHSCSLEKSRQQLPQKRSGAGRAAIPPSTCTVQGKCMYQRHILYARHIEQTCVHTHHLRRSLHINYTRANTIHVDTVEVHCCVVSVIGRITGADHSRKTFKHTRHFDP